MKVKHPSGNGSVCMVCTFAGSGTGENESGKCGREKGSKEHRVRTFLVQELVRSEIGVWGLLRRRERVSERASVEFILYSVVGDSTYVVA